MEAGQPGNTTGAIIQARMQSTRLPGKILMPLPLPGGKPLLQWIVDTLKECKAIDKIIIATTESAEDDALEMFAETNSIGIYRGSTNDVLSRFANAAAVFQLNTVARITGDNPVLDSNLIDQIINHHHLAGNDYTYSTHLPLGMNMEIVNAHKLIEINQKQDATTHDREHVTQYLKRNPGYKVEQIPMVPQSLTDKMRITVDYPADFALANILLGFSVAQNKTGMDLVNWVNEHYSWVWQINGSQYQKKNYASLQDEIQAAVEILERLEFKNAAMALKA